MSKVRVALIGAGAIGRTHAAAIMNGDVCELAAVADPSDAGLTLAKTFGVPWHSDYRVLLDAEGVEAAIIATPNDTHVPVSLAFVERGRPVLVEKPIASTVDDAQALTKAAEEAGVPVLVGHHRRHNPIIRRARDIVKEGRLGRLASASVLYTFLKPEDYFDLTWRKKPGGGPVLINLIHEIDVVRFTCGEIASVQAITSNAIRGFEVEDTAAVLLRLENGALVTISLSDTVAAPWSWDLASGENPAVFPQPLPPVNTHYISGTEGSLTLPGLELWRYDGKRGWQAPLSHEVIEVARGDPYAEQLRHLARVVRGKEEPLVSAADGTRTLRATLAVQEAARSGRPVILAK